MDHETEIVELLREIRDTQRDHLAAYREFTGKLAQDADQRYSAWRRIQDDLVRKQKRAIRGLWILVGIAAVFVVVVAVSAFIDQMWG